MGRFVLVTGPARSGKSQYAEDKLRSLAPDPPWLYLATMEWIDDEVRTRILRHQQRRGSEWRTVEVPHDLVRILDGASELGKGALIECVTVWILNRMLAGAGDEDLLGAVDDLCAAIRKTPLPIVAVTNEVGWGIVPDNALGRRFRDVAGSANQRLGAVADEVVLVTCGVPLRLR